MTVIQAGTTPNFTVSYDDSITAANNYQFSGLTLAQAVLANCEDDLATISDLFGGIMPDPTTLPFQIYLQAGTSGASHPSCLSTQITCGVVPNSDVAGVLGLLRAEMAEVFMATQNQGVDCASSNGEALSRVIAGLLDPKNRWRFRTGSDWLMSARQDWVNTTNPNDWDSAPIGCGTLFYYYLAYQLNFSWRDIIAAGAPTLGQTAAKLGITNAFADFSALLAQYFPQMTYPEDDNPFPLDRPALYLRHNLEDDGTSQTGALNRSPDIIVKNNPVANPQATYSTNISINSDTESDPFVVAGQNNYFYVRVWNRGALDYYWATAHLYWSPAATLVSPNLWNFLGLSGSSALAYVPKGNLVQVSSPGITWLSSNIPGPSHYCFVVILAHGYVPVPNLGTFNTFKDFVDYVYAHNNIAWHNFNVVSMIFEHLALAFFITGAWDEPHNFVLETLADLPQGSRIALEVPRWLGRGLHPRHSAMEEHEDPHAGPDERRRVRIPLNAHGRHRLGQIELPAAAKAASHLRVHIPEPHRNRPYEVAIRQLWAGREVGRITWRFVP